MSTWYSRGFLLAALCAASAACAKDDPCARFARKGFHAVADGDAWAALRTSVPADAAVCGTKGPILALTLPADPPPFPKLLAHLESRGWTWSEKRDDDPGIQQAFLSSPDHRELALVMSREGPLFTAQLTLTDPWCGPLATAADDTTCRGEDVAVCAEGVVTSVKEHCSGALHCFSRGEKTAACL